MRWSYIALSIPLTFYYYLLVFKNILTPPNGLIGHDILYPVNLVIHEAGHIILYPLFAINDYQIFGKLTLLYILGGSLLQWLIPLVFATYFVFKKQLFPSLVLLFWFSQSLISSVPYIADAKTMNIPLLAGGLIHDWNYILTDLDLLESTQTISSFVNGLAILLLTISVAGCWILSIFSKPPN